MCRLYRMPCRRKNVRWHGSFHGSSKNSSAPNYDLSTPNEAYFARVDRILQLAAKYGFLVILDPAETGGWLDVMKNNGVDKCRAYGQFLGKRYASFDNILWIARERFSSWPI